MNSGPRKAFLVFSGGNDRAVLAFLRTLRLCHERAYVIARTWQDKVLRTSHRSDVVHVRPTHILSLEVFCDCLDKVREATGAGTLVILPSTEYLNTFLLAHRTAIEHMNCEIPLVDAALYKELTDKQTGTAFFKAAGLAVPQEFDPDKKLEAPVVAKPRVNVSAHGCSLYPQLLETATQLAAFHKTCDTNDFFFQEFVRGDSLYLLFYISPQSQSFVWSQHNLLQQPGGKSMLLAEASDFHQSQTASLILAALRERRFHGLGMVEIIRTTACDVFIEMNPRIWGPAQFCLDQRQPLMQAFIGIALRNDATYYIDRRQRLRRKRYFWLGGVLETMRAKEHPTWHMPRKGLGATIFGNLTCDVFLRKDSWRCFMSDLRKTTTKAHPRHE